MQMILPQWMRAHWRPLAFALLGAMYLAVVLPLTFSVGANVEEIGALPEQTPAWVFPPPPKNSDPGATELRLGDEWVVRGFRYPPVWGVEGPDERYFPLLLDGHIGALGYYPMRWLTAIGGLEAARLLSVASGLLLLWLIVLLGRFLVNETVGWIAATFAAVLPLFSFLHFWAHADEQWSFTAPALAILALVRFHRTERLRWLLLGAFLLGFGAASKNTGIWTVFAGGLAAFGFRLEPKLNRQRVVLGGIFFALPILPQLAYALLAPSSKSFTVRLESLPSPLDLLNPKRLLFFARHFVEAVASLGTSFSGLLHGEEVQAGPPIPGIGWVVLAAMLVTVGATFWSGASRALRVFGCALGLLLGQYVALYYTGDSYFGLLLPWIPLSLAIAGQLSWSAAERLPLVPARWAARGLVVAAGLGFFANELAEVVRMETAARMPDNAALDLAAQKRLARTLAQEGALRPWTTTYAITGVLEVLSDGQVRPFHAYPLFSRDCDGKAPETTGSREEAWLRAFRLMGPGAHHVVLSPTPHPIEVSPCLHGELVGQTLATTLEAVGGRVISQEEIRSQRGRTLFRIAKIEVPEMLPRPVAAPTTQVEEPTEGP